MDEHIGTGARRGSSRFIASDADGEVGVWDSGATTEARAVPLSAAEPTEATRLLCAAAHLDLGLAGRPGMRLRRLVHELIIDNPVRAIGVSPGVDLRPVVVQCLAAERRRLLRDIVLSALLVALFVVVPLAEVPVIAALCVFGLACEVVYVEAWIAAYRTVATRMLMGLFDPERERRCNDARTSALLDEIHRTQIGDVTVYSGFTPFVGAGFQAGGWSFALNITQGKHDVGRVLDPKPFTVPELYAHVAQGLRGLGLADVAIEDRLYVQGTRAREDARFVPKPFSRPVTAMDPGTRASCIGRDGERERHYMVVRVTGWGGELVVSMYVRFRRVRGALFIEVSSFLLPPLEHRCHAADGIHRDPGWRELARLLRRSVLATPLLWAMAPLNVLRAVGAPLRRWALVRRTRRQIRANPNFDYGTPTSVRDALKSPDYRQYFQKLDNEMYGKVIERQLLDSITDFLDRHDIDTGDLKQRESTILNNGVLVTGGNLQAGALAVGQRARAFVGQAPGKRQATGPAPTPR